MRDFRDFVESVRDALAIEDIVAEYTQLQKGGSRFKSLCLFHEERQASFVIYPQTQTFKCFGCGAQGDVFQFIMLKEDIPFLEALSRLASQAGMRMPDLSAEDAEELKRAEEDRRRVYEILTRSAEYYHQVLPCSIRWHYYRMQYGFDDNIINTLQLGYADGNLCEYLTKQHIPIDDIMKAGLAVRLHNGKMVDYFVHRLIFPYWRRGQVVYMAGRETADTPDEAWERGQKYKKLPIHSDDGQWSSVSKVVQNIHFYGEDAITEAREAGELVIAEGITDCISALQHGVPCLSTATTHISEQQWPRFSRLIEKIPKVYIANDNEEGDKGLNGAMNTAGKLLSDGGKEALLITLPRPAGVEKVDLNDFLKGHNIEEFKNIKAAAKTLIETQIMQIPQDTPALDLFRRLQSVLETLISVPVPQAYAYLFHTIKDRFNLTNNEIEQYKSYVERTRRAPEQKTTSEERSMFSSKIKKETQAQILVKIAENASLFHDAECNAYATFSVEDHNENWPVKSKCFKLWLSRHFYEWEGKPPDSQAMQDALSMIEGRSVFDSQLAQTFTRVASLEKVIYIDLCNDNWEAVEISASGWRIVADPPVRFCRKRGMLTLPYPVAGGSIDELRPFVNVATDADWQLFISWIIGALHPIGPYTILLLNGEQGSGKSLVTEEAKLLIDPGTLQLRTIPREERDLVIAARNSWVLSFNNLSGIPTWFSDALCRLSTGGGLGTRELYTDADEILFDAKRPVIVNGITAFAERADLADRCIVLNLPEIKEYRKRDERLLRSDFHAARPHILGALYDATATAIRNYETTKLDRLPRMADFAIWASAAEPALPWQVGEFLAAYENNRRQSTALVLESDMVATAIRDLLTTDSDWEGTAETLLNVLEQFVPESARKTKSWPKSADSLGRRLKRVVPSLRSEGIEVEIYHKQRKRMINIRSMAGKSVASAVSVSDIRFSSPGENEALQAQIQDDASDPCNTFLPVFSNNDHKESHIFHLPKGQQISYDQAITIWKHEGAPVIHIGPRENCFDVERALSQGEIRKSHLEAIGKWLEDHFKK